MRILIIDSDWNFVRKASAYLESKAHMVVHMPTEQHALRQARQWQPDLVIVAAEATEGGLLESFLSLSKRPAVLLSEHMDRYDRAWRAWQRGGDELLMKPVFYASELQEAIATAMKNASAKTRQLRIAASA